MTAVLPSAPSVFGLAPPASRRSAAARSPASAASSRVGVAGMAKAIAATDVATADAAATTQREDTLRILDLRERAAAVADLFHRNLVAIKQCLEQIGKSRI